MFHWCASAAAETVVKFVDGVCRGKGCTFTRVCVFTWISYRAKDTPNIQLNYFSTAVVFAPSAPSLFICVIGSSRQLALSEWRPLQKSLCSAAKPRLRPLALTSKWSSILSDTQRRTGNRSKEGFSCFPSGGNDPALTSTCRGWGSS